jgi:hypothetical protein
VGTPFKGSNTAVARLQKRTLQRSRSKAQRSSGSPSIPKQSPPIVVHAVTLTGVSTPPTRPPGSPEMYTLLDTSNESVKILNELRHNLKEVAKEQNIPLTCFYEKLRTDQNKEDFDKEQKSTILDGNGLILRKEGLFRTHLDLDKFSSSEDPNYLLVKNVLKDNIRFTTTRRLWKAILDRDTAEVQTQISRGAGVSTKNSSQQNALHLAIEAGALSIVNLLLEKSVEVNAKDMHLRTPISLALEKGQYSIALALLKRGALASEEDKELAKETGLETLFEGVTYFEGPRIHPKKISSFLKSDYDNMPEDCRSATDNFIVTITTFHLRSENNSEKEIRDVKTPSADKERTTYEWPTYESQRAKDQDGTGDEDEREYHIVKNLSLTSLLFSELSDDERNDNLTDKEWMWYHLPANNVGHQPRLSMDYADLFYTGGMG